MKRYLFVLFLAAMAGPVPAAPIEELVQDRDVVVLGEVHDNPAHHETQARLTALIAPAALVFEMLSEDQAGRITGDLRDDRDALEKALNWADSGWPDFAMYYQVIQAAPDAAIYGAAVPRAKARAAFDTGIVESFGDGAAEYGLDRPLPEDQRKARLALQKAAHCDALPENLLPRMVELQRLRDAVLARMTLRALAETGGPVVVITGNGHARTDWGLPHALKRRQPGLNVLSIGQSEDGMGPEGSFDMIVDAPAVDRPDPCTAFR